MEDNKVRSEEDSTSKQTHVQFVNKQPSDFSFHQVLRCFRVVSSQFWTTSKFLSAPETTTNNQEVKRSLYRLQNVNILFRHHSVQGSHEIAQSNPRNQCESFPAPRRTCFDQALRFFARNYENFSNIKQRSKGNILVIHWTCFFAITRS